jgi:hypothetical protein
LIFLSISVCKLHWIRSSFAVRRHAHPPEQPLLPAPLPLPLPLAVLPPGGCPTSPFARRACWADHGSVFPCRPLESKSAQLACSCHCREDGAGQIGITSAAMAIRHYWSMAAAAVGFRLVLVLFGGDLHLSSRPEVSTPVTSLRRRKHLLTLNPSPPNPAPRVMSP